MKSIDKLHYKIPAGLNHEQWHPWKDANDAAMSLESFFSNQFEVPRGPEAMYPSHSQKNQRSVIQSPSSEPGNPGLMALVLLGQMEDCIF